MPKDRKPAKDHPAEGKPKENPRKTQGKPKANQREAEGKPKENPRKTGGKPKENRRKTEPAGKDFHVVGVGASAGGLEAFERLFKGLPDQPGMAFVVVSHLDPSHVSLLPELIQKCTRMRVRQITDDLEVRPDSVYVAPPNKSLAIFNRKLQLLDLGDTPGPRMAIDHFLRSLAQDQRDRAICIILSGMGTDGTLGLRTIKGEFGMAMVQTVESARYGSMPRSALETQLVDYVLPPEKMGEQLVAYAGSSSQRTTLKLLQEGRAVPAELQKIFLLLRTHTGHDFSAYKQNTICRRIERRMAVHQIDSLPTYVHHLRGNKLELDVLFYELLIGVTNFFRDPEAFEILKQKALPQLLGQWPADTVIRAWVPGCATGEEAYSVAMVLRECAEELNLHQGIQVFATDINEKAIETARTGVYPANIAADVTPDRLQRFFSQEDGTYRIRKDIREMLVFAPQNLIKDPPFTKLDLVSCRNLLIYLDGALQKKLLPLFHYSLRPGGLLFLGSSETIGGSTDLFDTLDKKWKIFQRKDSGTSARILVEFPAAPSIDRTLAAREGKPLELNVAQLAQRALLNRYAPASVIIGEAGDILYIHGRTGQFLEPAPGEARLNVFDMARKGLRLELPAAVHRVVSSGQELIIRGIRVHCNGGTQSIDLKVSPLGRAGAAQKLLLVAFEPLEPPDADDKPEQKARRKPEGEAVSATERELQYARESLQSTIEELETANEELKSTNEELQSTNEELQSTNEELETSKEEQQSLNEELTTVNSELQGKIEELTQVNNDMKNLLDSIEVPTIFLDNNLRIKRFTYHATRVIHLINTDVGRPISDLVTKLQYEELSEDARAVLRNLVFRKREIQTKDGDWYLMRILPYRTVENVIDGVVVTFQDINERKQSEQALRRRLDTVIRHSNDPIMELDFTGRVLSWNVCAEETYGWSRKAGLGMNLFDLLPEEQREPTRQLVERIKQGEDLKSFETWRLTKAGKKLRVWVTATRLVDAGGESTRVMMTERNLAPLHDQ